MVKSGLHTKEVLRFTINLVFAMYNCVLGISSYSWWFITISAYYVILSVMRISVIGFSVKNRRDETFIMKFSGVMIFILSVVLCGIVYMAITQDNAIKHHEITMITIALYAFTKLTLAITGFIKSRKNHSPCVRTLRSISFTDAVVSIYSLQRSMLVSFDGMNTDDITLFNTISGIVMCIIVIFIGLNLIMRKDLRKWQNQN